MVVSIGVHEHEHEHEHVHVHVALVVDSRRALAEEGTARYGPRKRSCDVPTFDVVSELDMQELKNALDQAQKEVAQRFDFKGTDASLELKDQTIVLRANSQNRVEAVLEVLHGKLVKRGVSLLSLDPQPTKAVGGNMSQQVLNLKQGIDQDGAKKVVKALKDSKLKVQAAIQGDVVRVSGKKRDDLQEAIAFLKGQDLKLPLQYKNFRD